MKPEASHAWCLGKSAERKKSPTSRQHPAGRRDLPAPDSQRLIEDALVCCARSIACCAILAGPFFPGLSRPFIRRWDAEETSLRTFSASIRDGEIAWGTALSRILPRKQLLRVF